jgi:signal transduction histidine kinase
MDNSKPAGEQRILLISRDAALCVTLRRQLETLQPGLRITTSSSVDAARSFVKDSAPDVILFDDGSPSTSTPAAHNKNPLDALVSSLAVHASVVVIAAEEFRLELSALVAAGVVDFVARAGEFMPVAMEFIERRLRRSQQLAKNATGEMQVMREKGEDFGEVLRHELNNPLTGILGNAELLLVEIRRKNDGRMPDGGQQRVETIAALAVRLRETVFRLSQEWEARQHSIH